MVDDGKPTTLTGAYLKSWNVGIHDQNKEAVLIVELLDGSRLAIQMPGITAEKLGLALVDVSKKTGASQSKPN